MVDTTFLSEVSSYNFHEDALETMGTVLSYYGDKEPQWLSELTHKEAPWREARKGIADGLPCSNIISKDSMQQYYGGL